MQKKSKLPKTQNDNLYAWIDVDNNDQIDIGDYFAKYNSSTDKFNLTAYVRQKEVVLQ